MSVNEHNSNQFLTQNYVIEQKGLTSEEFTPQILRLVKEANRKVVLAITPIQDDIILDGTKFFLDAQDAAYLYFDSEYHRTILKLDTEAKDIFAKYKESKELLIRALRAQPMTAKRSVQATSSCAYSSRLLSNIPGITDQDQNIL